MDPQDPDSAFASRFEIPGHRARRVRTRCTRQTTRNRALLRYSRSKCLRRHRLEADRADVRPSSRALAGSEPYLG